MAGGGKRYCTAELLSLAGPEAGPSIKWQGTGRALYMPGAAILDEQYKVYSGEWRQMLAQGHVKGLGYVTRRPRLWMHG